MRLLLCSLFIYLLQAHVNVMGDDDCLTPLIIASGRGFTTMVEKLIAAEAQVPIFFLYFSNFYQEFKRFKNCEFTLAFLSKFKLKFD